MIPLLSSSPKALTGRTQKQESEERVEGHQQYDGRRQGHEDVWRRREEGAGEEREWSGWSIE
jgi:hypothetical protein